MPDFRTPQENGALILRVQLDAKELLRRAEREQMCGSVAVLLPIEQVREIAARMLDVAALKELEHLELYGVPSRG